MKQWIDAYGDPRKPNVDPIDWVELIPITETRNYVQRVMENFVVYRAKFEDTGTRSPQVELAAPATACNLARKAVMIAEQVAKRPAVAQLR